MICVKNSFAKLSEKESRETFQGYEANLFLWIGDNLSFMAVPKYLF